uniref:RecF/RecN/SMC N-terminal domain-containing protein n=1 Tax=Chlamydomonas euryale TaxID=1486919 RepID=A0A7R9VBR7_9CHLO
MLGEAVSQAQVLGERAAAARAQEDPHARQLAMLASQLQQLRTQLEQQEAKQAELRQQVCYLEEADKALGRSGIPSFVLEGVLGELQQQAEGYLEQLADSMVLELRATRPASGKAAGATAGAAGDDDEPGGDASDGQASDGAPASSAKRRGRAPAKPAKSAKAAAATAAAGAVADREKEQISKVVKVQVGSEWLPRSLAQLSGGERRRVALAMALGFADLVRQRGRLRCNVLVLDEALQQLDAEGCARVASLLRGLPQETVLVVGQAHSFVAQAFDVVDIVIKVCVRELR